RPFGQEFDLFYQPSRQRYVIRVMSRDETSASCGAPMNQCSRQPLVLLAEDSNTRVVASHLLQDAGRFIGRSIVHDNQLKGDALLVEHASQRSLQIFGPIVDAAN